MLELPDEAAPVAEIIQAMVRAQKTLKMYPPNNPTYARAVDDVLARIWHRMEGYGELVLRFGHDRITMDGMTVYEAESRQDNFALFFYRDGIRELSFLPGLEREELLAFLSIISRDFDRSHIDDDIVTLLWEKDFRYIRYEATDEFLLEDEYDPSVEELAGGPPPADRDRLLAQAYEDALGAQKVDVERDDIAALTEKEKAEIERMKEAEETASPIPIFLAALYDLLRRTPGQKEFEETVDFIAGTLRYCFRRADFEHVFEIFRRTEAFAAAPETTAAQKIVLKRIPQALGPAELVDEMGEILDSGAPVSAEAFVQCAPFLDASMVSPLLELLGRLETMAARRVLIEVLAVLGRRNLSAVSRGLRDKRWYVVRNTLHILGKINDPRSVETLGHCVSHQDPRVRKEAFRALGQIRSPKILPYLKTGLADPDEAVRILAVKAFRTLAGSDVARRLLLEEINGKGFSGKSFPEKKEFFQVLALWDTDDVLGFLQKTLTRRALIARSRADELRACAASAVSLVKDPEPFVPFLQQVAANGGKLAKEAALAALRRIKDHDRPESQRSPEPV